MENVVVETEAEKTEEQDEQLKALQDALKEVEEMIVKVKENLGAKVGTSGDFCKLVEMKVDLRTQISTRSVKEVEVTWVDPEYLKN